MLEFITTLKQRYQNVQSGLTVESTQWNAFQLSIEQLTLIESFLHKGKLIEQQKSALNIAVIGPTQSGKSTVVNLLLDQEAAGVSPLAGYTVYPQGFANHLGAEALAGIEQYFIDYKKVEQFSLTGEKYTCYSISHINAAHLPACMLWDTPDFDSIDACRYRDGVLKTLGLADVLVLVVSKEKYADQSVWDTMSLLEHLRQPVMIVMNKLMLDSQAVLLESFKERWQQVRNDKLPNILPVLFNKAHIPEAQQSQLVSLLHNTLKKVKPKKHDAAALAFIKQYWQSWLEPVRSEQEAHLQWQLLIEKSVKDAMQDYKRDYLDHPHHYDTFQNALAQLLTLLEIPGLANVLAQSRKILAWPLRKVFSIGKKRPSGKVFPATMETVLLQQIVEHVFLQLGDHILQQIELTQGDTKWWRSLNSQLRKDKHSIIKHFEQQTLAYHENFKQEIDITAQSLYHKLEEHPAILNGLRATRVTTDAVLLALAVQAGGIGLQDLLLAPAMLSITSFLAESAIGSYLHRAEDALKQKQFTIVEQRLFHVLQKELTGLPEKMMQNTYFNISVSQLAVAEMQLEEKRHGLRIL